ncbi:MAG TPA: NAD(P)H-binding protein [Pseudonocardia sp.]|nr:NAD(P)H-binding protein [Pseudonocardia sp.]
MTILITGARGTIGSGLLRRLHGRGLDVRASGRDPEQLAVPAGVPVTALDLSGPHTFGPALTGVTDLFLYAEPVGIDALLAAASAAGVKRVVLLSSDAVTEPHAERQPLARHHLAVERALLAAPLTSTLLRPGAFAGNALGWSTAIRAGGPVEQAYPDARTAPIHPEDIVDVAELALTEHTLDGRAISLTGPEPLTFRDQVAVLAELLGRPIELRELTREQATERMGRYMPAPVVQSLLNYWAGALGGLADGEDSVRRITGRPGRTFRQWAGEHLAAFA